MTAKVIRFPGPGHYPDDIEGVHVFRHRGQWALRAYRNGRTIEIHGLSKTELRDLRDSIDLAIAITD